MRALLSPRSGSGALRGRSDRSFRRGRSTGGDGYGRHPRQEGAGRASVPAQLDLPTHSELGGGIGSWRRFCGAVLDAGLWRFASRESSVWITCRRGAAAAGRAPVGHPTNPVPTPAGSSPSPIAPGTRSCGTPARPRTPPPTPCWPGPAPGLSSGRAPPLRPGPALPAAAERGAEGSGWPGRGERGGVGRCESHLPAPEQRPTVVGADPQGRLAGHQRLLRPPQLQLGGRAVVEALHALLPQLLFLLGPGRNCGASGGLSAPAPQPRALLPVRSHR